MLLVSLLLPFVIGFLIVQNCLPNPRNPVAWLLSLSLATPLGMAVTSGLYFLWFRFISPTGYLGVYLAVELALAVGLLGLTWLRSRSLNVLLPQRKRPAVVRAFRSAPKIIWLAAFMLLLFLLNFLDDYHFLSLSNPDGDWDAWAIWNLRARFIASGPYWRNGFSSAINWSHPDYPVLLPGFIARCWVLIGSTTPLVPALVGLAFALSILGTLIFGVTLQRGYEAGIFAGIFGLPLLMASLGFKQYADMPLAFYFLAANLALFMADAREQDNRRQLFLAGLLAAAAAWTKNEGAAFVLSIWVVEGVRILLKYTPRERMAPRLGSLALGMLPLAAVLATFKTIVPSNDLMAGFDLQALAAKLSNGSRYSKIYLGFVGRLFSTQTLRLAYLPFLFFYGFITGFHVPRAQRTGLASLALRLLFMLGIYFCIYMITPRDLDWHIGTSMDRLVYHLLPSTALAVFLSVNNPARPAAEAAAGEAGAPQPVSS